MIFPDLDPAAISFSTFEYAEANRFIKQYLTMAEILQSFWAFLTLAICIKQGADSCQTGLKVERRVRVERAGVIPIEVSAFKTSGQTDAGTVCPTTAP
jgi:hypothetical protein